jgi:hypothetical protein
MIEISSASPDIPWRLLTTIKRLSNSSNVEFLFKAESLKTNE